MRVFLTGATGFIGSALIPELLGAGHHVVGLTRSDAGAKRLESAGVEVHRGTLEEPDTLRSGAAKADGVVHAAFDHDFANFVANCAKDRRAIVALGEALAGSDRPLVITSGVGPGLADEGGPAREDVFNLHHPNPRIASELAGADLLESGVNVSVMRLPQVHDPVKQGLLTPLIAITRQKGRSAYVGEGLNRWAAAHISDVARCYRLALERGEKGARYNAVGEEGVSAREIATVIGRGLNVPVVSLSPDEVADHFGWMALFADMDMPASRALTEAKLGWHPTGPGLIADLGAMDYSAPAP